MKKVVYWLLIILLVLIFLASAITVVRYLIGSVQYKDQLSDLQQMHTIPDTRPSVSLRPPTTATPVPGTPDTPTSTPYVPPWPTPPVDPPQTSVPTPTDPIITPPDPSTPGEPVMLPELKELYQLNKDLVGYIYIEDTNINNPVVQRKEEKDYYLYRDFFRDENQHGSVYVREACDVFTPSDVVTLYGHNMADGTMFANLHKYKKRDFFNSHPVVYFDTLYERHAYQVVCVFRTSAEYGVGFPYHLYGDFANKDEFNEFVRGVRSLAILDSGISVSYGDKFICLSTCEEWPIEDGRLVLVAVRID